MAASFICEKCDMESYIHTFAPTAQFKCCVDACGNDTKLYMRRLERSAGNVNGHAFNAWEVFLALERGFPSNPVNSAREGRFKINERFQLYTSRESQLTDMQQEYYLQNPDKIVLIPNEDSYQLGDRNKCKDIKGIRLGVYQLRVTNQTKAGNEIYCREVSYWCKHCREDEFDLCVQASAWKLHTFQSSCRIVSL